MIIKNKEIGSLNLHMIKTTKFKSLFFDLIFTQKIEKDKITINNLLIDNLLFSCKKYDSAKKMSIKKQDLYGASLNGSTKRLGKNLVINLSMSILNPKYTEDIMLEESLNFYKEIILNPNIENNAFDEEIFNLIKNNIYIDIKSVNENKKYYALSNLKEGMDKTSPISYRMEGYIEDLDKITNKNLYKIYQKLLKDSVIDLYVVGDFDFKEMEKIITKKLKLKPKKKQISEIKVNYKNPKDNIQEIIEETNYNQSTLALGYSFKNLTNKEKEYTLVLYNIILGNSPDSKLFKNIREKKSYAYNISSNYKELDGILTISAGINSDNYMDTLRGIHHELENMKNGDISEKEIDSAKQLFISALNEIDEYPSSIIDHHYSIYHYKRKQIKTQIKNIKEITKEEIIKVAKKIELDTIYLLKEENHEENKNK